MAVQLLWRQERVQNKEFTLLKVHGDENMGGLMTKYLDKAVSEYLIAKLRMKFEDGRSQAPPLLQGAHR